MLLWTLLFLLLSSVVAQSDPAHTVSFFQNLPAKLFFFDDTTSVIYHDVVDGNVWVSEDEGRYWKLANGIPTGSTAMVIQHPFDNHYVSVSVAGSSPYMITDSHCHLFPLGLCFDEGHHSLSHRRPRQVVAVI